MKHYLYVISLVAILLLQGACSSNRLMVALDGPFQAECLRELITMNEFIYEDAEEIEEPSRRQVDFPDPKISFMAEVLGVSEVLYGFLEEIEKAESEEALLIQYSRRIERAIQMASFETSAITGGIDCEEEKSEQIANFLENRTKRKETNRTVAAIVTGALVSTGTGVALIAGASGTLLEVFGIAGGLTEVWLGVSILRLKKYVDIDHPVNVIHMVYENDNSEKVFPVSVWKYITIPLNEQEISKRERVIKRWDEFEVEVGALETIRSEGGRYDAEMLKTRANMLDQLEAQIYLMKQDLMLFTKYFYSLQ